MESDLDNLSNITSLVQVTDDDETENVSADTEITLESTNSTTLLLDENKINQISLTFMHTETSSQREKCKFFWKYVDSRPDLEELKVVGWNGKFCNIHPHIPVIRI